MEHPTITKNPEYGKPDAQGFVGVSPEYANAANDTDLPYEATEDEGDEPTDEETETGSDSGAGVSTPPAPPAPPAS